MASSTFLLESDSRLEAFLRRDSAVKHARVLNLGTAVPGNNDAPRWVVALALDSSGVAMEGTTAAVVKRIRRAMRLHFRDTAGASNTTIPSTWAVVDAFPTTASGAVDDVMLANQLGGLEIASAGMSTLNKLRGIIAKVLKMPLSDVVPSNSFIRLGGDSIKAVEVMSRCLAAGLSLQVRDITDSKNLSELATLVRAVSKQRVNSNITNPDTDARRTLTEAASIMRYWDATDHDLKSSYRETLEFSLSTQAVNIMLKAAHPGTPLAVFVAAMQHSFHRTFPDHEGPNVWFGSRETGTSRCASLGPSQSIMDDLRWYVKRAKDALAKARKSLGAMEDLDDHVMEVLVSYVEVSVTQQTGSAVNGYTNGHGNGHTNGTINGHDTIGSVNGVIQGNGSIDNHGHVEFSRPSPVSSKIQPIFDIKVKVTNHSSIKVKLSYPRDLKRSNDVQEWFEGCRLLLESELASLSPPIYSLSDFPRLPLSYAELDDFTPTIEAMGYANVDSVYPTSALQDGILLSQITSADVYRIDCVFEISGRDPVSVARLESAWNEVVSQYAALRTIFIPSVRHGAMFDQVVLKRVRPKIVYCGEMDTVEEIHANFAHLDAAIFASDQPAHSLTVAETTNGRILCKLEISHAAIDGISVFLICNALAHAYNGKPARKHSADLGDYISYLQDKPREKHMAYWTKFLSGVQPCLFPPLAEHSPALNEMKTVAVELDSQDVKRFCRNQSITVATLLKAAWSIVLRGYTTMDDVCFGYLSSGRDVPIIGTESIVGPLINLIVSRVNFDNVDTSQDLLLYLKDQLGDSIENQNVSLAEIQHAVAPGTRRLFNTLLSIMYEISSEGRAGNGVDVTLKSSHAPTEVSTFYLDYCLLDLINVFSAFLLVSSNLISAR